MPTKTVKFNFQAEPTDEQDVNVRILVDGVTVFDQTVPTVGPVQTGVSDPAESFTFDLDVAASGNVGATENHSFSITAVNGIAKIENILSNFTAKNRQTGNVVSFEPGTAEDFVVCNIVSQPTWNGEVLLSRYDIQYNNGPQQITGPGEVLVLPNETAVFDVAVWAYNDSAPPV